MHWICDLLRNIEKVTYHFSSFYYCPSISGLNLNFWQPFPFGDCKCWQKGKHICHPSTRKPGSLTDGIRHTLRDWSNQFPFALRLPHSSLCLHHIPLWNGTTWEQKALIKPNWMWNWCQPECVFVSLSSVCIYHSLSLLRCMTAPCRHSLHTTISEYTSFFFLQEKQPPVVVCP